jgi:glutamate-1-semialdehyde 2,1-aminomutase
MPETKTAPAAISRQTSADLLERAKKSIAGGVSSAFRAKSVPHPLYFTHGEGPSITDVDGNTYLDYTLAWGPLILGHSHPAIASAVEKTLRDGWDYGAQHEGEIRVAERLVDLVRCADRVVFSNTGTEADQIAFRLSRAFTGRKRILRFQNHYHGWLDAPPDTLFLPWNDLGVVEQAVAEHDGEIACVILEPILCNGGCILPAEGYLAGLREITAKHGIVLIFDEVITGFRVDLNGAQGLYGITPDLATFGKAVAGGFPLSVIAGRYEIMKLIEDATVLHGGSFNGNPTVLAAAEATLEELARDDGAALKGANRSGEKLIEGIRSAAEEAGVPVTVRGVGTVFKVVFPDEGAVTDSRGLTAPPSGRLGAWLEGMLDNGVYLLPDGRWYVSTVHGDDEVEMTLEAARFALNSVAEKFPAR